MRSPPPADPTTELEGYLYNASQRSNEFEEATIGVSLSGGGLRSTLFSAGAVVAIADAGLWDQVRWIASVSGGSFTNALAGMVLRTSPSTTDIDEFLRVMWERVTGRFPVLSWPRSGNGIRGPSLLGRSYQAGLERLLRANVGPPDRLTALQSDQRLHAFLAVDLATLSPIAITDRIVYGEGLPTEQRLIVEPGDLPLATAVRASATFPLLPAVRISVAELGPVVESEREDLFLGDGGLWNNLGTNWETQFAVMRRDLVSLPPSIRAGVDFHLVIDASAPVRRPNRGRTAMWPIGLDRPVLSVDRALQAAFTSTLDASRRAVLGSSPSGAARLLVSMGEVPEDQQPMSILVGGASRNDWSNVRDHNEGVGTVLPTVRGLAATSAVHLLAHGYGQCAAVLSARGVPFSSFQVPHERIRGAIRALP